MTAIRIETQEQADAVPGWSTLKSGEKRGRQDGCVGCHYTAVLGHDDVFIGDTLTHVTIPIAEAIEVRRKVLAWAHTMDDAGFRHGFGAIADLILPEVLADAAEAQARPAPTCAEVLAEVLPYARRALPAEMVDRARAALDAEEAKP